MNTVAYLNIASWCLALGPQQLIIVHSYLFLEQTPAKIWGGRISTCTNEKNHLDYGSIRNMGQSVLI